MMPLHCHFDSQYIHGTGIIMNMMQIYQQKQVFFPPAPLCIIEVQIHVITSDAFSISFYFQTSAVIKGFIYWATYFVLFISGRNLSGCSPICHL